LILGDISKEMKRIYKKRKYFNKAVL